MTDLPGRADRLVTVFGGSGFVGRHVVRALANQGWRVRVACRRPDLAFYLQPLGGVGQVSAVQANLRYPASIDAAARHADAVINLAGVLSESGEQKFEAVHIEGARAIALAAAKAGAKNLVHVSAIGACADSDSAYARSKAAGEAAICEHFPQAVILRPSVLFGAEDFFFNRFAALARHLPILPLVGSDTLLQPAFVGDVAQVAARAVAGGVKPGAVYELGGPEKASLRDIVAWTAQEIERKRLIVPLNARFGGWMAWVTETAARLSYGLFPPALTTTRDQLKLLARDNVVSPQAEAEGRTFKGLGIEPESFRTLTPGYLWRYRRAGQFDRGRNREGVLDHPT